MYVYFQVGDRLFSAFGQDIIDALFWTATETKDSGKQHLGVIPHLIFAVIYVCILSKHRPLTKHSIFFILFIDRRNHL